MSIEENKLWISERIRPNSEIVSLVDVLNDLEKVHSYFEYLNCDDMSICGHLVSELDRLGCAAMFVDSVHVFKSHRLAAIMCWVAIMATNMDIRTEEKKNAN